MVKTINYEIAGAGPSVLLLHGWGGCIDSMRPIMNVLCRTHKVVVIDFPAHGASPAPETPWRVDDFSSVLMQVIEKENLRGCDVFAHSFGARVAIKLAAKDSTLFRRIALTGAAGIRPKRGFQYYMHVYRYKLMRRIAGCRFLRFILMKCGIDVQSRIQNAGSADYRVLSPSMRRTFSLIVNENLRKYLPKIKNPVLLLWGEADLDTPIWMAKTMEKLIPDCGLVTYQGATHFAYLERLGDILPVLECFFGDGDVK